MNDVANQQWNMFPEIDREKMSRMAAAAAWGLSQWDAMDRYVNCIPRDTTDGAFYRAVLCVHKDQFIIGQKVRRKILKLICLVLIRFYYEFVLVVYRFSSRITRY